MELDYLHLPPEQDPPSLTNNPFRAVIVSEVAVNQSWRNRIAEWLVKSGCLYVVAWGVECEDWHDTVDWTVLEAFDFGDIPDDKFVMTTWHEDEPLSEALWFAGHCASHPEIELKQTVIFHIAEKANRAEMLKTYAESQTIAADE
jgi:hypothetical protein